MALPPIAGVAAAAIVGDDGEARLSPKCLAHRDPGFEPQRVVVGSALSEALVSRVRKRDMGVAESCDQDRATASLRDAEFLCSENSERDTVTVLLEYFAEGFPHRQH